MGRFKGACVVLCLCIGACVLLVTACAPLAAQQLVSIGIDAGSSLGSAAKIGNFLGIQGDVGAPGYDWRNPDKALTKLWADLGLDQSEVELFDGNVGVTVTRDGRGEPVIDYTNLDANIRYLLNELKCERISFDVCWMPGALAYAPEAPNSWQHAPASYDEWRDVVTQVVSHIESTFDIREREYYVLNEISQFKGRNHAEGDYAKICPEYMEMFFETWRAIKAVDPELKVGFPMTTTCSRVYEGAGVGWGVEYVVEGVAAYNREHPEDPVTLDVLRWQDYNWTIYPEWGEDGSFMDGVNHIRGVFRENGLPEDTPMMLQGWSCVLGYVEPLERYSAHIVSNVIEQVAPGQPGGITWASYFNFYDSPAYPASLVTGSAPCYHKTRNYAAFQALHDMEGGTFLGVSQTPGSPIKAMATREGAAKFTALMVNYMEPAAHAAKVTFNNLPGDWESVACVTKRIDETHSADGEGLECGLTTEWPIQNGSVCLEVPLPTNSIVQITLQQGSGAVQ